MASPLIIARNLETVGTEYVKARGSEDGFLEVMEKHQTSQLVNLYLYQTIATPTLEGAVTEEDRVINIDSNVGIVDGSAITFFEGINFSQSIVKSTTAAPGATLTMVTPIDKAYTTGATVEVGKWNINLDGSTPITLSLGPPSLLNWHIRSIAVSITDNVAMDSAKFGGIAALTNGILIRRNNGILQNTAILVNNIGFSEQGFITFYDDKAPAGIYGVRHRCNYDEIFGSSMLLEGATGDCFEMIIQDDLTDLTSMVLTINGHVYNE